MFYYLHNNYFVYFSNAAYLYNEIGFYHRSRITVKNHCSATLGALGGASFTASTTHTSPLLNMSSKHEMAGEFETLQMKSITKALEKFVTFGKYLLQNAKKESRDVSLQDFVAQKISLERDSSLLGLVAAAAELYRGCPEVQGLVDELLQLQTEWDAFLECLDAELQMSDRTLSHEPRAGRLSTETTLTDARTGEPVTLAKYLGRGEHVLLVLIRQFACLLCRIHLSDLEANQDLLDAQSVRVVVVSFGCQEGARYWLEETACRYDMLLDPQRKIYRAFGLGASLTKVLRFNNMLLYAEYILSNYEFPRAAPSIEDDMYQLGGDIVLGETGKVIFSHCCMSPVDRPAVSEILAAITKEKPQVSP
ncbi:uncharacterized protein LOC118787347 isoform X2 [Megalops cyprinoides]|uniref:uncharacterized protein LOC118787347 isoform X2 n=1 Tax=Megalops cyprinoides TaxID=118141 RepID=UPI001864CA66|nr:uncharacterized protein LOC118787347 isoform X2 [Megalops cyprinoides]